MVIIVCVGVSFDIDDFIAMATVLMNRIRAPKYIFLLFEYASTNKDIALNPDGSCIEKCTGTASNIKIYDKIIFLNGTIYIRIASAKRGPENHNPFKALWFVNWFIILNIPIRIRDITLKRL